MNQNDHSFGDFLRTLVLRARIEGRRVWLPLLQDRLLWNESPPWAQDECVRAASETLGRSFLFAGSKVYECGGQRHRIASFRYLGPDPTRPWSQIHPLDWVFRLIPGGRFAFGSPASERGRSICEDTIEASTSSLLVAATPTTQAMWETLSDLKPSRFLGPALPVETITPADALAWLKLLPPGFRLPIETEWEFACRSGTTSVYCFGDKLSQLSDFANHNRNRISGLQTGTTPVASLLPNAFGLYDVHGNVWELCRNYWFGKFSEMRHETDVWQKTPESECAIRGGSWYYLAQHCRSACRRGRFIGGASVGLRLVYDLPMPGAGSERKSALGPMLRWTLTRTELFLPDLGIQPATEDGHGNSLSR